MNKASDQGNRQRSQEWAREQLAEIKGEDPRRVRRLQRVLEAQHLNPGASLPLAHGNWADAKGAYRLAESGAFSDEAILASHRAATLRRIRRSAPTEVLVVQDTTSLNYSDRPGTDGLGPIGNNTDKTLGLFAHSRLCLDASNGQAFGLLGSKLWARDAKALGRGPAGARNRQPIEQKESLRWLEGYRDADLLAQELGTGVTVTCVADREGDIYEVFVACQQSKGADRPAAHLLVRAQHNRQLNESAQRSHDCLRQGPMQAELVLELPARAGRPARQARLEIRYGRVEVAPPCNQRKYQKSDTKITLGLIIATEIDPPAGQPPVEWILWSSRPPADSADAINQLGHYARRWQIEVLHRILKTGCKAEARQLTSAAKLKLFLAVDLLVAVYLLGLTQAARTTPQVPATDWLTLEEQQALSATVERTPRPLDTPLTLDAAVGLLGRLGGHLGRKGDGTPGPHVLWRGLQRLADITAAWRLFASMPPTSG